MMLVNIARLGWVDGNCYFAEGSEELLHLPATEIIPYSGDAYILF